MEGVRYNATLSGQPVSGQPVKQGAVLSFLLVVSFLLQVQDEHWSRELWRLPAKLGPPRRRGLHEHGATMSIAAHRAPATPGWAAAAAAAAAAAGMTTASTSM
jgi:hypothetical protein